MIPVNFLLCYETLKLWWSNCGSLNKGAVLLFTATHNSFRKKQYCSLSMLSEKFEDYHAPFFLDAAIATKLVMVT